MAKTIAVTKPEQTEFNFDSIEVELTARELALIAGIINRSWEDVVKQFNSGGLQLDYGLNKTNTNEIGDLGRSLFHIFTEANRG